MKGMQLLECLHIRHRFDQNVVIHEHQSALSPLNSLDLEESSQLVRDSHQSYIVVQRIFQIRICLKHALTKSILPAFFDLFALSFIENAEARQPREHLYELILENLAV